jgi:hypothetical protein
MWSLIRSVLHFVEEMWAFLFLLVASADALAPGNRANRKARRAVRCVVFRAKPRSSRLLLRFAGVWVGAVVLVNLAVIVTAFLTAGNVLDGAIKAADIYSPFEFATYLINVILIAPAALAYWWADRIAVRKLEATAENGSNASFVSEG